MAWLSSGTTNEQLVCQLKENDLIKSDLIERAFTLVDRGLFVPGHDGQAYADMPVKVGNVHISAPHMYATILEALHLAPGHTFLNIGSGSGYLSSLVSTCVGAAGLCHGVELRGDVVRWATTCQEKWRTRIEEMRMVEKKKEDEKKMIEKNQDIIMTENGKHQDVMMHDGIKNEKREGDPLEAEAKRQKLDNHKDQHDHKDEQDDESITSSPSLSNVSSPPSNVSSVSNVSSPLSTHTSTASSAANSTQTTPNTNRTSLMSFLMRNGFIITSDEREGEEEPENDSDDEDAPTEPHRRHVIVIPDILHLLRRRSRPSTTTSIRTWMIPDICKCQFFEGDAFCIDTTDANMKYDRIYVGAGAQPHHKEYFERMLAIGGVMVAPIGHQLVKVTRTAPTTFITRVLTEVGFAPLVGDLPDAAVTSPTSPSSPLSPSSTSSSPITSTSTSASSESSPTSSPSRKPLLLFPSPIYTPETHPSFPTAFQHAVDACIILQRRHDGLPSRLPLSLWLDIIQYANRRWWVNVNAATSIPPSPQVNPETEGSPYDPVAAVSNRFWL